MTAKGLLSELNTLIQWHWIRRPWLCVHLKKFHHRARFHLVQASKCCELQCPVELWVSLCHLQGVRTAQTTLTSTHSSLSLICPFSHSESGTAFPVANRYEPTTT
jgi:hypothetical protein